MATIWFLVSIVLFIMYRRARAQNTEDYNRGVNDGYASVRKKINELGSITPESVRAIFDPRESKPQQPTVAERAEVATRATVESLSHQLEEPTERVASTPHTLQPEARILTPEELQAKKEQRTLSNLNALLYVGSFLIVAAMAVFVTLTMPAAVKLVSLAAVIAAFYIVGLMLHTRVERLRPAALAFVGTGLAILPFFGLALNSLGGVSASIAWFATSIIGIVAYSFAAVRLQSQLVSFLTMAFILSFALSSVSTLGLGMMWYFIVLIGVSLILNAVHYLAPKSIPQIFTNPVEQTAKILTPTTLIASFSLQYKADIFMYEVLFGLAALQYIVTWLHSRLVVYEVSARILAHITILLVAFDLTHETEAGGLSLAFGLVWLAMALAQALYSLVRVRVEDQGSMKREGLIIGTMFGLLIFQLPWWTELAHPSSLLAGAFSVIGILAVVVWRRLHQPGWLYLTLAVSVILPFIVGLDIISPPLSLSVFPILFTVLGALGLVVFNREVQQKTLGEEPITTFIATASVVYITAVVASGLLSGSSVALGLSILAAGALTLALSYILRWVRLEAVSALLFIWSVVYWVSWFDISPTWNSMIAVIVSAIIMLLGAALHQAFGQYKRRTLLATITVLVLAMLVFVGIDGTEPVRIAAVSLLLAAAVGAFVVRVLIPKYRETTIGKIVLGAYVIYPLLALVLCIAAMLGNGWIATTLLVSAVLAWAGSYLERRPSVLWAGNLLFVMGLIPLWYALDLSLGDSWMMFSVSWVAATVYYLTYWYTHDRKDEARMQISFASSVLVLIIPATQHIITSSDNKLVIASAVSIIAISIILGVHGYMKRQRKFVEAALYIATFGLQRIAWVLFPDLNKVFYAHWWAGVIMYAAAWQKEYRSRAIAALALITTSTGIHALEHGQFYTIFFLVEHLIITIIGAMGRTQWVMWWGIIATIAAVLYFLRDYTFLMLMFLGVVLISFVVWRLLRSDKNRGT